MPAKPSAAQCADEPDSPYRSLTRVHQLSAYHDPLDPAYGITLEEYWRAHVSANGDHPAARRCLGDAAVDALLALDGNGYA